MQNSFDLRVEILKSHSKYNTVRVAAMISRDEKLFGHLMDLYFEYVDQDLARKAAWVLRYAVEKNPDLINPYIPEILDYISKDGLHDAVKRNGLAILSETQLPKKIYGRLTDLCFRLLQSEREPVAVKAFSMDILNNIGKEIPEIQRELKLLLNEILPYQSRGIKARAKKILGPDPAL